MSKNYAHKTVNGISFEIELQKSPRDWRRLSRQSTLVIRANTEGESMNPAREAACHMILRNLAEDPAMSKLNSTFGYCQATLGPRAGAKDFDNACDIMDRLMVENSQKSFIIPLSSDSTHHLQARLKMMPVGDGAPQMLAAQISFDTAAAGEYATVLAYHLHEEMEKKGFRVQVINERTTGETSVLFVSPEIAQTAAAYEALQSLGYSVELRGMPAIAAPYLQSQGSDTHVKTLGQTPKYSINKDDVENGVFNACDQLPALELTPAQKVQLSQQLYNALWEQTARGENISVNDMSVNKALKTLKEGAKLTEISPALDELAFNGFMPVCAQAIRDAHAQRIQLQH